MCSTKANNAGCHNCRRRWRGLEAEMAAAIRTGSQALSRAQPESPAGRARGQEQRPQARSWTRPSSGAPTMSQDWPALCCVRSSPSSGCPMPRVSSDRLLMLTLALDSGTGLELAGYALGFDFWNDSNRFWFFIQKEKVSWGQWYYVFTF